jgi:hypothetical protein
MVSSVLCWLKDVRLEEGISNLNPDFADRWRHLVELHAAPRWLWRGEARFKIGQPNIIGPSVAADRDASAINSRGKCS